MRADKASGVLTRLLGARGAKRFLESHWPHDIFVFHGARKRLAGLTDIPELESVESLLRCPADRLMVQNDHRTLVCESPDEARELYDWGYQLYWDNIRPESASFDAWLRGLEHELGLPQGLIRCNAFACTRECTTVPGFHFDYGEGFTIQVQGKKQWRYLDNRHVRYPDFTYMLGEWVEPDKKHFFERGRAGTTPGGRKHRDETRLSALSTPRGMAHDRAARRVAAYRYRCGDANLGEGHAPSARARALARRALAGAHQHAFANDHRRCKGAIAWASRGAVRARRPIGPWPHIEARRAQERTREELTEHEHERQRVPCATDDASPPGRSARRKRSRRFASLQTTLGATAEVGSRTASARGARDDGHGRPGPAGCS